MEEIKKVKIISKEGEEIETNTKIIERSNYLKNASTESNDEEPKIELTTIKSDTIKKILEYLDYYQDKEPKEIIKPMNGDYKEYVGEWDYNYTDIDLNSIFDIITACNFLNIRELLELMSLKLATKIKGKSREEIKETFNIQDQYTPEEEEELIKQNQWCMENL